MNVNKQKNLSHYRQRHVSTYSVPHQANVLECQKLRLFKYRMSRVGLLGARYRYNNNNIV